MNACKMSSFLSLGTPGRDILTLHGNTAGNQQMQATKCLLHHLACRWLSKRACHQLTSNDKYMHIHAVWYVSLPKLECQTSQVKILRHAIQMWSVIIFVRQLLQGMHCEVEQTGGRTIKGIFHTAHVGAQSPSPQPISLKMLQDMKVY